AAGAGRALERHAANEGEDGREGTIRRGAAWVPRSQGARERMTGMKTLTRTEPRARVGWPYPEDRSSSGLDGEPLGWPTYPSRAPHHTVNAPAAGTAVPREPTVLAPLLASQQGDVSREPSTR